MATITYANPTSRSAGLLDRISTRVEAARAGYARWRVYRSTYGELAALSNRDLDDLGISRSSIRAIALEAAYGK